MHNPSPNVIVWLVICLLNHSLEGGRANAIDFFRYNIDLEEALARDGVVAKEARFDLATMQFDKGFPMARGRVQPRARSKPTSAAIASHPTLRSANFPVLREGCLGGEDVKLTIYFDEWLGKDQKKHLREIVES